MNVATSQPAFGLMFLSNGLIAQLILGPVLFPLKAEAALFSLRLVQIRPDSRHRSRYLRYNSFIMPQCASSIIAAFSSASRAARSLLSFRLLALLGLKGAFVCPSGRCDIGCRYVRGMQGCKVGSFQPPDELAGICTG